MPSSTKENKLLVFLSYAREDKSIVDKLYKRLKRDGFDPWMDQADLLGGQNWPLEIERAMKRSHVILLCFSKTSIPKESYIQREYKKAMDLQQEKPHGTIFSIPVRLDDCPIPDFLGTLQYVDFPKQYRRLVLSLRERAKNVLPVVIEERISNAVTAADPGDARLSAIPSKVMPASAHGDMDILKHIFKIDKLYQLVGDSFKQPGELQQVLVNTLSADLAKHNAQELIGEFIRNNGFAPLLSEIKKRNPAGYRDFLAATALAAIGWSPKEIPSIETDARVIEAELLSLQKTAIAQRGVILGDPLEFEDREELFSRIRDDKEAHVVLHGPSGVGKTHFLKQLQERYQEDTLCVLIDLGACKPKDILRQALEQLGGEAKASDEYQELAKCINTHLDGPPQIRRFYFLFDNADHNQPAIDYLFSPENIIENPRLQRYLKGWGLTEKVRLKIVVVARHPLRTPAIHSAFLNAVQIKINPLNRHSVFKMLERLVKQRGIPVHLDRIDELSDEVYYLTGGHPKSTKQMLVALAEQGCVMPTAEEWIQLYKEHVIATIHAEMLQPIDPRLFSTIWNLSIFRRFDQRLLGGLLDRGILSGLTGDNSRQAREWRTRLDMTNFFEGESETSTVLTNYVMRHALSLNLQLDAPNRYKVLHAIALQMYLDRFLSSEAGSEQRHERLAVNLIELLYHWTKLLEMEPHKKEGRAKARLVCPRLRDTFDNYLKLAFTMVRDEDQPAFFRVLKSRWEADAELQQAIRRCTPQEACLRELQNVLQNYDHFQDGMD